MIIVKILGGLGNQLFQYAAGKALAQHNKTELKLDPTGFEGYALRNFELQHFKIPYAVASPEEVKQLNAVSSLQRVVSRFTSYKQTKFYKEPFFHFDENFFKLNNSVYIRGYFQSERYFAPALTIIKQEFALKKKQSPALNQFLESVEQEASVSLHVRRGDYKAITTGDVHGILPSEYYQRAMKTLIKREPAAKFYVFSDDPEWAKTQLDIRDATIVSGDYTKSHLEDFHLMQHCRHNIIANSSFSWWAAWLNSNPNKIIIAPKKWFNNGPKDTQDLIPESWMIL